MLYLLIHEHVMSLQVFFDFFHERFIVFSVQNLYMFCYIYT